MPSRTTPSTATGGSAETAAESETVKVDPRFVRMVEQSARLQGLKFETDPPLSQRESLNGGLTAGEQTVTGRNEGAQTSGLQPRV